MNVFKATMLLALMSVLLVIAGGVLGGQNGMTMALIFAVVMNFVSYWFSDRIVLKMYKAKEVTEEDGRELHSIVQRLSTAAGLPKPKVYIINSDQPNAFATGRNPNHSAVAVTTGILRILTREELEGVIGHELSHIKNRDILVGTIAATIAAAISFLATMTRWSLIFGGGHRGDDNDSNPIVLIVMMIVAPFAALIIQMFISRSREYGADASGARIAGNPLYLAGALRKLNSASQQIPMHANPATSHMFIVNPLSGGFVRKLFSTHPPAEERISRLENMGRI